MKVWNGIFKSFEETKLNRTGFHDPIWFDKQVNSALISLDRYRNKVMEVDLDYSLDYFLISLVSIKSKISVCDFGGAMGQMYFRLRNKLSNDIDTLSSPSKWLGVSVPSIPIFS